MKRIRVGGVIVGAGMSIGIRVPLAMLGVVAGCGGGEAISTPRATPSPDGGNADGGAPVDATQPGLDAGSPADSMAATPSEDATGMQGDGSAIAIVDAASAASDASRFITGVVQFSPTECTGFGASSLPNVVEGPPVGGGSAKGSTDVVSLGSGGSIVVTFAPNAIVDGPGPDFIVFENPFWVGGNSDNVYAEPGEVSVSDDGETWTTFSCTPTFDAAAPYGTGVVPPYGSCAGWSVVYSNPDNGISPFDPATAGGNAYDLADIGVTHARFIRIVDQTTEACPDAGGPDTNGFDLDAIAIINAELP